MCLRCKAPFRRYLIQDRLTGFILCEECGFAVQRLTVTAYQTGRYIWDINPAWPRFNSFEDLYRKVTADGEVSLPPCRIVNNVPSRMLTRIFDLLQAPQEHLQAGQRYLH